MRRNHTDILTIFKITVIQFKFIEKIVTHTNWKLIGYPKTTNEPINNSQYMSIDGRTTDSNYNKYILQSGNHI